MTVKDKLKNKGSSIFLSPIYDEIYHFQVIDLLPLLFDKVISVWHYLGETESVSKYYSIERIKDLCENQILIFYDNPIETYNSEYIDKKPPEIMLERWIDDEGYFLEEDIQQLPEKIDITHKLIDEDLNDEEFSKLRMQLPKNLHFFSDFNASDELNIDLIDSLYLNSPLLVPPQLKSIWAHKFERMIKQSRAIIPSLEYPEKIQALSYFLKSRPLKIPQQLSIDDLIEFRKDKEAIEFRMWLDNVIQVAKSKGVANTIDLGQELRMDFQELCKSYEDRSNIVATSISGMATSIAGIIGGPIGGLVAVPSYLISLKAVKLLWEKYGTNNWTFFFIKKLKRE